jgi:type IV secretion system protein VirD4
VEANHEAIASKAKPEDRHKLSKGKTLAEMMIAMGDRFERVVAGQGESLRDMADKERESVLSEARTQTQFLDSPALRDILKKSSFRLKDVASRNTSVFLCLPARHMSTHDRWLRVIVNLAVGALEPRRGPQRLAAASVPVLLLLEEFPVLGHMEKLEAAAGQLAGSGVKLWVIIQNLGQLKRHYKHGWETFIANSGVLTAFGNADLETLQYISQKMGKVAMNIERRSGASLSGRVAGAAPTLEELRDSALLEVDELSEKLAREKGRVLVLAAGQKPAILERARYFKDTHFDGLWDP